MTEMPSIMRLAAGAARHAASRQALIAANVANADTPGYRPVDLTPFHEAGDRLALRRTDPRHMAGAATPARAEAMRDAPLDPNGNGVSLQDEVLRSVQAGRSHGRALAVYSASLDILRASLGRR